MPAMHGERSGERAEEVLLAVGVDAVFYPHSGVVLAEHGGRHAHHAQAAVRRRGGVADHVLKRAAADDYHRALSIEPC
jgi:hypothetical protein